MNNLIDPVLIEMHRLRLHRIIDRALQQLQQRQGWHRMQRHYNLLAFYERRYGAY